MSQDLIERFLLDLRALGRAEATQKAYGTDARWLLRYLGHEGIALSAVTRGVLRGYLRHLTEHYEGGTVHRKFHGAKVFLRWCVEEGILEQDPAQGLALARLPDKDPVVATDEEVEKILRAARHDLPALAALMLLAYTGARRSELLGALWGDIDWERRTLRLRGKGGHNRTVPLVKPVLEVLLALRGREWTGSEDPLLVNRFGQPLGRDGLRKVVDRYTKEAGITRHLTPHAFRHGVASRLAARAVDPFTIAELLGHRDLATTQRYVHPGLGQKRDALEALAIGESAAATSAPQAGPAAALGLLQALLGGGWEEMANARKGVFSGLWQDLHSLLLAVAEYQHEAERRAAEGQDRA